MKTAWIICITLMTFAACRLETENVIELQLSSSISNTRAVGNSLQNEFIVPGQLVGVTVEGALTSYSNIPWTCLENGLLVHDNHPIQYNPSQTLSIKAYQPYQAEPNNRFQVSTSQDKDKNYVNSDLLYAEATVPAGETQVNLTFHHVLSKVNVILNAPDNADISDAVVTICGTRLSALISDDIVSPETNATVGEISAGTGPSTSVIVIPQTVPANTGFIKVKTQHKVLLYTLCDDLVLLPGNSYTYNLSINDQNNILERFTSTAGEW